MGFYDTTINESTMYANLDFMSLAEDTKIPQLPESSSLLEDALFAIAESEENYNNIMKACAMNELVHFQENGTEYMFTEASGTGFLASARAFFRKIWEKIKSLFKKFAIMLAQFIQDDKTFVKKNQTMIVNGITNIPSNAEFMGYRYNGFTKYLTSSEQSAILAVKGMDDAGKKEYWAKRNASITDAEKAAVSAYERSDDYDHDELMEKVRGELLGTKDTLTQSEFQKDLYTLLRGSDSKESIDINAGYVRECMSTLESAKKEKDDANKAFAASKKFFDNIDKELGKDLTNMTKSYKDFSNDAAGKSKADEATKDMLATKRNIDYMKAIASTMQAGNGIFLTCIKDRSRQAKAICVKVATYSSKVKNEGAAFTHYEGAGFLENVVLR